MSSNLATLRGVPKKGAAHGDAAHDAIRIKTEVKTDSDLGRGHALRLLLLPGVGKGVDCGTERDHVWLDAMPGVPEGSPPWQSHY